jgi:hypothetical protein
MARQWRAQKGGREREREREKKGEPFEFQGWISAGMGVCVEEKLTRHDRGTRA